MITQEQINKLEKGDPLIVQGSFNGTIIDGDVIVNIKVTSYGKQICGQAFCHPSCVSLPPDDPKYDPFRKFKDGDEARVVPRDGRRPVCFPGNRVRVGDLVTVRKDEDDSGVVQVCTADGFCMRVVFFFLELVTPVEKRMPYSIDPANSNVLFKHGKKFAIFEDDDEAQDLCDRLNAEHRKEQSNG